MGPELPPLVERTLARLIRAFAPERVVLFGSYAKGTANGESDVDLLVIANIQGSIAHYQRLARQLAADCFPRIDVVVATPTEVANAADARSPFLASILTHSVTLYTRPC
jgi:predicted nucleotidyltransferase